MPTLAQTKKRIGFKELRRRAMAKAKEVGFTRERLGDIKGKIEAARQKRREEHPLIPAAQRRKPPTVTPEIKARVQAIKKGLPAALAKRRAEARPIPLRGRTRTIIRSKRSKLLEALRRRAEA